MAFMGRGGVKTRIGKLSIVQLLVLILLNESPAHGYEILQKLNERLCAWRLKSGTVYPVLHRLLERGLIDATHVPQESSPDAIRYNLTQKGKETLHEALHHLDAELKIQDDLWQFLSDAITPDSIERIGRWAMKARSPMGFVVMRRHCDSYCRQRPQLDFLKHYKEYLQKELDWVNEQLMELKKSKNRR